MAKKSIRFKKNAIYIDDLPKITVDVKREIKEKKFNPGVIQDKDAGTVFIEGEPMMIINDKYMHYGKAQIVLQTRKVVREYLKLEKLKNKAIL